MPEVSRAFVVFGIVRSAPFGMGQMNGMKQYLFACGDFQQARVQERIFGRRLTGTPNALEGFCRAPFVRPSVNPDDRVEGRVFGVKDADLTVADAGERPNYRRSRIETASGLLVWDYLRQD